MTIALDLALGFVIGLSLGLLGGGGSILTVPALVYVVGQNPRAAVTASLVIVGINSLSGMWLHRGQGTLNTRVALTFGGAGMAAAFATSQWSKMFASTTLLIAFAVLMFAVGAFMILRKPPAERAGQQPSLPAVLLTGAAVGALTGFLGVGGGFLIVPALVMIVGLPMRQAIGTSLLVIAMNSLAGVLGHLGDAIDLGVVLLFAAAGIAGTIVGARLSSKVDPNRLRQVFAVFVIGLAVFVLYDNVSKVLI
jgi:uncharacterized protein